MLKKQQLPSSGRWERQPGVPDPALYFLNLQSISSRILGRREQTTAPLSGFWLPPTFALEKGSPSAAHSRNSSDSELLEVCRLGAQARHRRPLEGAGKEHGGKAGDRRDGDRDKKQGL